MSSNNFSNAANDMLTHLVGNIYSGAGIWRADLHVADWPLHLIFLTITLGLIPMVKLFHFSRKQALRLGIKLIIQSIFYSLGFCYALTVLCSFFGMLLGVLLAESHGLPVSFFEGMWTEVLFFPLALIVSFVINHVYIKGQVEPYLEGMSLGLIRKNSSPDKQLSDIRFSMDGLKTKNYEINKYVNFKKGVFVGLNDQNKPIYIPIAEMRESHIAVLGATGNGKGVVSQVLLTQLNRLGSSLVILDPKKEEYLYSVFKSYAQGEFVFIDLDAKLPQLNPIAHLNRERLYPILESAFGLKDKGQEADYYRGQERVNLRKAMSFYNQGMSFDDWFKAIIAKSPELLKTKDEQLSKLGHAFLDISLCRPMHGINQFDLKTLLNNKGTLYVKCQNAKSSSSVRLASKIVLMAILDEIEHRTIEEEQNHVEIMLDELKFILTERVSQALGSIRNKGGSIILNFQSEGDLVNLDDTTLDGKAIQQQINANTAIKICHRTMDNENNNNMSTLTGTVIKESRSSALETNQKMVAISQTKEAYANQHKEGLYTENDFLSLPKRAAILIGVGIAKRIYTAPPKANKVDFPSFSSYTTEAGYLEKLVLDLEDKSLPAKPQEQQADSAINVAGLTKQNSNILGEF